MERIRIDDVDSRAGPATVKRPLAAALGASDVALNYYELAAGESFAYGYHRHESQEELFVVERGEVTFETKRGDVVAEAGEVVRFEPGEWQRGVNTGGKRVVALAIGAPQDAGETEIRRECERCGERTPHEVALADEGDGTVARCLDCGAVTGRFQ